MSTLENFAQQGIAAIEEKRFDDAIEAFTQALALDDSRPDMNHALGMAYLHRGDVGNGIPHLERAVALAEPFTAPEVQPMRIEFHMQLATAYQLMDRVDDAIRTLAGMARTWPDQAMPHLRLGSLLLTTGEIEAGLQAHRDAAPLLDEEDRKAAEVLVAATEAFIESENPGAVFLEAHAQSYKEYFDQIAGTQAEHGWYAEAARMARGPDGEPTPILADGARPYALTRVDLVNPVDGTVSGVYSETEPMIVAIEGLEPLAQVPIAFPWNDWPFDVLVSTQSPWHWLPIVIQFESAGTPEQLSAIVDETIGDWYLAGYNGEFGDKESGRFHYVGDAEPLGDRALGYTVDLGRARYEAIPALLKRLAVLHDKHAIRKVLFGTTRVR